MKIHTCKNCDREVECQSKSGKTCEDFKDELCADCSYEVQLQRSYQVGISAGLEQAASFIMEEATTLFAAGDDQVAGRLRRLANELQKRSDKAHPGIPKP